MCQTNSSLYFILLHSFFVFFLCLNLFLSSISRMNCISSETRKTSLLLTKSNTCVMCASCVKCRKYIRLPVECKWPTNCGAKNLLGFFFLYSTTSSCGQHYMENTQNIHWNCVRHMETAECYPPQYEMWRESGWRICRIAVRRVDNILRFCLFDRIYFSSTHSENICTSEIHI